MRTEQQIATGAPIYLFEVEGKQGGKQTISVDVLSMDDSDEWLIKHVERVEGLRRTVAIEQVKSVSAGVKAHMAFSMALIEAICDYSGGALEPAELRRTITGEQAKEAYRGLFMTSSPFMAMEQEEANKTSTVMGIMEAMGPEAIKKAIKANPDLFEPQGESVSANGSLAKEASGT